MEAIQARVETWIKDQASRIMKMTWVPHQWQWRLRWWPPWTSTEQRERKKRLHLEYERRKKQLDSGSDLQEILYCMVLSKWSGNASLAITTGHKSDGYYQMRKHSELMGEISSLSHREEELLSETIPSLCWELAQLLDTYILQGDYDLKIMCQEFYISWQKMFIQHLVNQLARHQFLKLACLLEKRDMLGAFSLLKVNESELQGYFSSTKGRVDRCLALIQAASEVQEQGAVDDRDNVLHGVRDLLSVLSNAQVGSLTYVSAPGIIQQISGLKSDLAALQSDLENTLPEDRNGCINELCTLIQNLQRLLFASSTTAQPILTSRELDEMEKVNAKLSAAVEEGTLEHCKKIEIKKHHTREVELQRRIFVDFFCNPDRWRNQVRELTARVRSMQVS